jgi:hypothetical protein
MSKAVFGGLSLVKEVTPEVKNLLHEVEDDIISYYPKLKGKINPIQFSTQVVSGINYYIKLDCGDNEYVDVKIFKPLRGAAPQLRDIN